MNWETWALFVVTASIISLTPGPAVLFVLSQAVRRGPATSVWASLGILSANAIYYALSATSLGAVIVASYDLFFWIKWLGAGYLIYLGLQCFFGKHRAATLPELRGGIASGWKAWRDGVLMQLANPKALLFFVAVLPQFVDPDRSLGLQIVILGISEILVEFCILFAYGQLAGRALSAARNPHFERMTTRIAGGLLIAAGLGLARLRRT